MSRKGTEIEGLGHSKVGINQVVDNTLKLSEPSASKISKMTQGMQELWNSRSNDVMSSVSKKIYYNPGCYH